MQEILDLLMEEKDEAYADFQRKLMPSVAPEKVIGVRTPILRKLAKRLLKEGTLYKAFMQELPHTYFDENQLHAFLISEMKEEKACMEEVEKFLPYIDNWATCDQLSPKVWKKQPDFLLSYIPKWIHAKETYTIRFGIGMLMQHFLDERFEEKYLVWVSDVKSDAYYVNMEIAWYMATALAKQWDSTIPLIEERKMDKWVQNKTIQKARESYRITNEQKEYLKSLKK